MNQRFIAPCFFLSLFCAIGLAVEYLVTANSNGNPEVEGALIFGAFGGIGVGLILWAKHLFPKEGKVVQERHHVESPEEEHQSLEAFIAEGGKPVTRRKFLVGLAGTSMAAVGVAALFPLKSFGPNPGSALLKTHWKRDDRLTNEAGDPVLAGSLEIGSVMTVFPEGAGKPEDSAVLLIRVEEAQFVVKPGRDGWAPDGHAAFSKVCTHVGCPVGLYRETTHELLCPCHQSTFDVMDGATPIFGPATRPLPQLPIYIDDKGYLRAQSDFHEPIGPGFWDRNRHKRGV